MKKIAIIVGVIGIILVATFMGFKQYTKSFSPATVVKAQKANISVTYCQPSKKNREIFGSLVPYNQVWRTGANEATTIEFDKDLEIDGKTLKAGKYTIWTIPNEQNWEVIFNSEVGQWGTQYSPEKDVLKAPAQVSALNEVIEKFEIRFNETENITLELAWDKTLVSLPLKLK